MGSRLPPGEAERRAAERRRRTWAGENYSHYDPSVSGFGNPEDWERIAEELFGATANHFRTEEPRPRSSGNKYLDVLGLAIFPATVAELKSAMRAAMMKAHPDHGGTNEAARAVLEAFAILKRRFAV